MSPDYTKIVTIEPGKRGGKPCIRGLRITVYDVLEYLASGMSEDEILADFPDLKREDIRACPSPSPPIGSVDKCRSLPCEGAVWSQRFLSNGSKKRCKTSFQIHSTSEMSDLSIPMELRAFADVCTSPYRS